MKAEHIVDQHFQNNKGSILPLHIFNFRIYHEIKNVINSTSFPFLRFLKQY